MARSKGCPVFVVLVAILRSILGGWNLAVVAVLVKDLADSKNGGGDEVVAFETSRKARM